MKAKFYIYFSVILILLIVCYEIWPVPFWYMGRKVILPVAQVSGDMAKALVSPFGTLMKFGSLEKDNKSLENTNNELEAKVAQLNEQSYVCKALGSETQSSLAYNVLTTAKVVGRSAGGDTQVLIVDKGKNFSVREGAAVLSSGYLVGRVSNVFDNQSEITLVTSHLSLIPAILQTSREGGLLQGGLEGLSLTEVPISVKISGNENVITSGLGGDLPEGIIIGKTYPVVGVKKGPFQTIKINSPIDFSAIEFVSILK